MEINKLNHILIKYIFNKKNELSPNHEIKGRSMVPILKNNDKVSISM